MGGLWRKIPFTFAMMTIGTLALTGFPFTAGYFSKDAIIEAAFASDRSGAFYGFVLTTLAAGLTSFYSWRLVFLTFFGEPRWAGAGHALDEATHHAHEETHGHDAPGHEAHEHERMVTAMHSIRMNRRSPCSSPWACWPSALCSRVSSLRMISSAREVPNSGKARCFSDADNHILEAAGRGSRARQATSHRVDGGWLSRRGSVLSAGAEPAGAPRAGGAAPLSVPSQQMVFRRTL